MSMLPTSVVRDASEVFIEPGAGEVEERHTGSRAHPRNAFRNADDSFTRRIFRGRTVADGSPAPCR